jgi:hypothetical protein
MHHRTNSAVILLVLTATATGCASLPSPTGVTANGEPLSVQESTHSYTYRTKERVGEAVHRDSHGHRTGSSTIYVDRRHTGTYTEWSGYQGDAPVSDDDFFRLAKDQAAVDEIKSSRESGITLNRIGWGATLGGIGATGAGIALALTNRSEEKGLFDNPLAVGLSFGGAALWALGMYLVGAGTAKAEAKHPLEQKRAEEAAERYNKSLATPEPTPKEPEAQR